MKKAFTIIEVSILFVVFLIVAFLVAPLSLDDSKQVKNIAKWRNVQEDFSNLFYAINTLSDEQDFIFEKKFKEIVESEVKTPIETYKITYMNGVSPALCHNFKDYKLTYMGSVLAYKFYDKPKGDSYGMLMYDVNAEKGPNAWGKDVFGYEIYNDRFEPFGKNDDVTLQKLGCSKNGTGLTCSNYYLIGGSLE